MKNVTNLIPVILILLASSAKALTGGVIGNGGDSYALQFVEIGKQVAEFLGDSKQKQINVATLKTAMDSTKVESTDKKLSLNGVPKDAINYPSEKRILFNRQRWMETDDRELRAALVLHEYLGIMGIDDNSYKLSKQMLKGMKYGTVTTQKRQDALSPEVVEATITGSAAKELYDYLQVPVDVLPGLDGEQLTKNAYGIICAVMRGTKNYYCSIDVGAKGTAQY